MALYKLLSSNANASNLSERYEQNKGALHNAGDAMRDTKSCDLPKLGIPAMSAVLLDVLRSVTLHAADNEKLKHLKSQFTKSLVMNESTLNKHMWGILKDRDRR